MSSRGDGKTYVVSALQHDGVVHLGVGETQDIETAKSGGEPPDMMLVLSPEQANVLLSQLQAAIAEATQARRCASACVEMAEHRAGDAARVLRSLTPPGWHYVAIITRPRDQRFVISTDLPDGTLKPSLEAAAAGVG